MHFILTPVGSSGDVLPLVGIGRRLRERGHDVTVVTAEPFGATVERAGLRFVGAWTAESFHRVTGNPDLWHPRRGLALVLKTTGGLLREAYARLEEVYDPGRSVLVGHTLAFFTRVFEEAHGAPAATIHLAPNAFRSDFRQPVLPPSTDITPLPRWLKRTLWWAADRLVIDPHIAPALNAWRAELGLAPVSRVFRDWIHSPRLVVGLFPDWFGDPQPDWPAQARLTGFPLFDEAGRLALDPDLERFLEAGDPPLVFTPGSANRLATGFFRAALEAARHLGRRALFVTPYREQLPDGLPAGIRHVPYAPFSLLLPRAAALVHHGGIGTCAQGLAAGIPQLVMPMGFDQPDNGARLARLGAGSVVTPRHFTGSRVAAALAALIESQGVAEACFDCRARLRAIGYVDRTCDLLERVG